MRSLIVNVEYFSNLIFFLFLYCTCWFVFASSPSQSKRCGQEFPHGAETEYKGKKVRWNSVRRETVASHMCHHTNHPVFYDTRCSPLFQAKIYFISSPFLGTAQSSPKSQRGEARAVEERICRKIKTKGLNERLSKLFARAFCTIADYERFLLIFRLNRVIDFLFMLLLSGKWRVALITNFPHKAPQTLPFLYCSWSFSYHSFVNIGIHNFRLCVSGSVLCNPSNRLLFITGIVRRTFSTVWKSTASPESSIAVILWLFVEGKVNQINRWAGCGRAYLQ